MKAVLINPAPLRDVEMHDHPDHAHIGLAYIGAYLEKQGVDVAVIDAKLERLSIEKTLERFRQMGEVHLIGLTGYTHDIVNAAEVARRIKEISPETLIIIGGVHATAVPKETLMQFPPFDVVCVGE